MMSSSKSSIHILSDFRSHYSPQVKKVVNPVL